AQGAGPGHIVAVRLPRGHHLITTLLAIWKTGAAYLPIDPALPPARQKTLLAIANPTLLITEPPAAGAPAPLAGPHPDDLAYVLFTSGSTGEPKAVAIPHSNLTALFEGLAARIPPPTCAQWLTSPAFDISLVEMLWPLIRGGTVVVAPSDGFGPGRLTHGSTADGKPVPLRWLQATPSHVRLMLTDDVYRRMIAGLDCVVVAGEAFPPDLAAELLELGTKSVINGYGPTEATVYATVHQVESPVGARVPIGEPLPHTITHTLDPHGQPLPPGAIGQLHLTGHTLAWGYLHQPATTADHFTPNPHGPPGTRLYHTGDLTTHTPDHTHHYLGRTDHQLKIAGHRIEPAEIEHALTTHPHITHATVTTRNNHLTAYITTTPPTPTPHHIHTHLTHQLPHHHIPTHIITIPHLPLTPNGKIDHTALNAIPLPRTGVTVGREPRPGPEQTVAAAWRQALQVERVAADVSFFDSGGSSLQLIQLHALLDAEFPGAIRLIELFTAVTIEQTAELVSARQPPRTREFLV
ncbi:non-ribosomal peptide synthetase, partial [Nonomuraea sp. PA05]|uniref:non-ribosomal peptide synthetase n=1 Tax=Nonomuraea sp. PA05 TaxID=2604466 RepID=UPI0011D77CE6